MDERQTLKEEIERLKAQNKELLDALKDIAEETEDTTCYNCDSINRYAIKVIEKAEEYINA